MCRRSANCSGVPGDDLGEMTIEECCTSDAINGLGFSEGDMCSQCIGECVLLWHKPLWTFSLSIIVLGFFQDSFVGKEQKQSHTVQAGYQKGATFARTNLIFNVTNIPGTAS